MFLKDETGARKVTESSRDEHFLTVIMVGEKVVIRIKGYYKLLSMLSKFCKAKLSLL